MMRTQGMRSSCALVACILVGLVSGGCAPSATDASMRHDTLIWGAPRTLSSPRVRTFAEFDPLTIRPRPGGFAALDRITQQLVLLDTTLRVTARVGRRGGGPRELDGVLRIVDWEQGLAIGEGRNRRITLFSAEGEFRGIAGTPYAGAPFAIRADRWFATASASPAQLVEMSRLDARERQRLGARPAELEASDARHFGQDLVRFREDGSLLVLENRTGHLIALRDDGTMTARWILPDVVLSALRARRTARVSAVESASGARVYSAPLFKDLALVGDQLLILQPLAPHCMLLVDLRTASILALDGDTKDVNDAVCRAESVAMTAHDLILAVNDSLLRFASPIRPYPSAR
jgi:hypothetical protein